MADVEYTEIPQDKIERVFGNYRFIHADYGEGLNYNVNKELVNRDLDTIREIIGEPVEKIEEGLSAEKYLEMMYPLLQKLQIRLKRR